MYSRFKIPALVDSGRRAAPVLAFFDIPVRESKFEANCRPPPALGISRKWGYESRIASDDDSSSSFSSGTAFSGRSGGWRALTSTCWDNGFRLIAFAILIDHQ